MARFPIPGSAEDVWGVLLKEFLRVSHWGDGTLRDTIKVVNIRDYGAVGDGSADDTNAIQAGLDACYNTSPPPRGSYTPSIVFFPPGLYQVSPQTDKNYCLLWRTGVSIIGAGPGRSVDTDESPWGGSCLIAAESCNVPVIYADTFVHHSTICNLRITQKIIGNPDSISNCHGIHIDASKESGEASGFGELTMIDRVFIAGMGGDGIRFGNKTVPQGGQQISSQPLYLGLISVHVNGGYGVSFIGENHGHAYIQAIKGDGNRKSLIRFQNISGSQANIRINSVGVESGPHDGGWWKDGGHKDAAIDIVNSLSGNIHIGQLSVITTANRNNGAAVIRVRACDEEDKAIDKEFCESIDTLNVPGPQITVDKFVRNTSAGIRGYAYFYKDENIKRNEPRAHLCKDEVDDQSNDTWPVCIDRVNGTGFSSTNHIYRNVGWNKASPALIFGNVKDQFFSISGGDNHSSRGLRINHQQDGANSTDVRFYAGETQVLHVGQHGLTANKALGMTTGTIETRTIAANISLQAKSSKYFQIEWSHDNGVGLAGDITIHCVGSLPGAINTLFSLYLTPDGSVNQNSLQPLGGTGVGPNNLTIHPPEMDSPQNGSSFRIRFENTHTTNALMLMVLCRITGDSGSINHWQVQD